MLTADDVTDYLLSKEIKANGKGITNLDVQKILYFAQGWHLAINGERLFQEELRAWVHGPVVPEIYFRLAQYEKYPIPVTEVRGDPVRDLPEAVRNFLDQIWTKYSALRTGKLVDLTHEQAPWRNARGNTEARQKSEEPLSSSDMMEFFRTKYQSVLATLTRAEPDQSFVDDWNSIAFAP
ncbi:MAG TPA: type II toxin-antitoxin system antitoxin SocA domain-containing protein [Skermanella sp.]|jgi:uncharacterized phage-associated protein|nr:type II toxin-antitoxin system antitoxin SocA domain-containing protein [Skermanella sp.]